MGPPVDLMPSTARSMFSSCSQGRLELRKPTTAFWTAPLRCRTKPKTAYPTRARAKTAKKP
jgi:hypothetical protein